MKEISLKQYLIVLPAVLLMSVLGWKSFIVYIIGIILTFIGSMIVYFIKEDDICLILTSLMILISLGLSPLWIFLLPIIVLALIANKIATGIKEERIK